ncbi:unannotated protein [freshwater metagenome]|uniref:Unannotated protein n=1 Tax=freshwater metagenome TaxID=449393 RepID=A0A6J7PVL3_9ZZZZ
MWLYAPRILNEPVRCRYSSFNRTVAPHTRSIDSTEVSGVRRTTVAMRSRAW